jgi:hypothetical protein
MPEQGAQCFVEKTVVLIAAIKQLTTKSTVFSKVFSSAPRFCLGGPNAL